jgi:RNA polymerase sigma-32 factor
VLNDGHCYEINKTKSPKEENLPLQFDTLQKYFVEIKRYPVLTMEEENEISRLVFDHQDMDATEKLAVSNLRIVIKIAMQLHNPHLNILDLIQEGNIALLHAVKKYNPYKGTRFSTYAYRWIRGCILKYIFNSWSLVKIGTTEAQHKLFFRLNGEKQRLEALGINPTPKLIADNFDVKEWEVEYMEKRLFNTDMTLDVPIDDGSDETLMDRMKSDLDVEQIVFDRCKTATLSKKLKEFKDTLDDRDLYIFNHRVATDEPLSRQEIGNKYQISLEWARQLEMRVIKKFKQHCLESSQNSVCGKFEEVLGQHHGHHEFHSSATGLTKERFDRVW